MKRVSTQIVAEIGINHNGNLDVAKNLIDIAQTAGCDFVKFQKRNPDICVPEEQKNKPKSTPWGEMTYLEYKKKIEFGAEEYREIDRYCRERSMRWFASVWDLDSVEFMKQFPQPTGALIMKIPSAKITDLKLCSLARANSDFLMISTGMSTEKEVERCINVCLPDVVFHSNSSYPSPVEELNLNYIHHLRKKYGVTVGYSGHEFGLVTTYAAVALGATWVERHITHDRRAWGSDQDASIEPSGLHKLVRGVRDIEVALGSDGPRKVTKSELPKKKSLR